MQTNDVILTRRFLIKTRRLSVIGRVGILDKLRIVLETFEPVRERTNNLDFRPGPTQTSLYSRRRYLEHVEASNFG